MAHRMTRPTSTLIASLVLAVMSANAGAAADFAPAKTVSLDDGVSAGTDPTAVASGDLNNDGIPDLVFANYATGDISVLLGQSGNLGTFGTATNIDVGSDPTAANRKPASVAIGDVVGDPNPDIVVAVYGEDRVDVLQGDGAGGFTLSTFIGVGASTGPRSVTLGDADNDGDLDIITGNFTTGANTVSVWLNDNGADSFTEAANSPFAANTKPFAVTFADATDDGVPDILVTNFDTTTVSILAGSNDGNFAAPSTVNVGSGPHSIAVGDINGDGSADLAVANSADATVSVLLADGAGGFIDPGTTYTVGVVGVDTRSVAFADIDDTSTALDLVVVNAGDYVSEGEVRILRGDGAGSFTYDNPNFSAGIGATSLAIDDFDGDGRLDIAVANDGSSSTNGKVLINDKQPVAVNDSYNVINNSINVALDVLANDSDPDAGDSLTITTVGAGDQGGTITTDGSIIDYTPAATDVTETFTYTVEDQFGYGATATVTVTVGGNQAPTDISLSASSVDENAANGTVVGTLSTTDPDTGDSFTYSLVNDAGGRFAVVGDQIQVADGSLLDFETATSHVVRVQTTDAGGLSFEKDFTIYVNDVNEAPTDISLSPAAVDENAANNTVVGTLSTTDPDSADTHSYTLLDDAGGRFQVVGNEIRVADGSLLDFEAATSHSVTVRTTDSGTGSLTFDKTITISVNNVNEAPGATAPDIGPIAEDSSGTSQVTATDPDAGETFSYAVTGPASNGTATVDGSGLATYTPDLNFFGSDSFTVTVTDSGSLTAQVTINVTVDAVNDAPTAVGTVGTQSGTEGTAFGPLGLSGNFADVDSTLTYSIAGLPTGTGLSFDTNTAVLSGTPTDADAKASPVSVTVTASDGVAQAQQTFDLNIADVNNAPAFTSTPVTAATEDAAYSYAITAGDADAGDSLGITVGPLPGWLTLTDNGDGTATLSGTPGNGDVGDVDITLTVDDGNAQASQPFTITVTNVNDAPTASAGGIIVLAGQTATVQVNASDVDAGDSLTYAITQAPATVLGTATVDASGLVSYDATGATPGSDSIEVTVSDQSSASVVVSIPLTVNPATADDSNGDGVTDTQATDLGLDPDDPDGDTDGDGIADANEIGDPANPVDADSDGVIDALEAGGSAIDASVAAGLPLDNGDAVTISASGQTLSGVAAGAATGTPKGVAFPLGTISYTTTSAVGGSVTVRLTFSAALPTNMKLYKVDNNGTYTELPDSVWTQVNTTTIDVTLTDGDPTTDLDGVADGSIEDPLAVGSPASSNGGGGGCTLSSADNNRTVDPLMPLMVLAAVASLYRRRRHTNLK